MKTREPGYIVYSPPMNGLPYLAVILKGDGTIIARPFETAEDASKFNREIAAARHPGTDSN